MGQLEISKFNPMRFELQDDEERRAGTRIKVIGVGGGGSNAVARMMTEGVTGVDFHILNTDRQALVASPVPNKLQIGTKITNGLGAGADPATGRQAALEDTDRILEILDGADMVFVTAGLGGGTGTGAAPVVAALAKEMNALTVAVVTKPFEFEGPRRMKQAEKGLADLAAAVDTVISIPNNRLLELVPKGTSFFDAFRIADDVLRQGVQGISDIMTTPGLINRDFSDIRAIMSGMGYAMMGTASAEGKEAAMEAARQAISSPLLEEGGVEGARGILINITGSSALGIHDVNAACSLIRQSAKNDDVQINFGVVMNEALGDIVKITVIATGFNRPHLPAIERKTFFPTTVDTPMLTPDPHMRFQPVEVVEEEEEYFEAETLEAVPDEPEIVELPLRPEPTWAKPVMETPRREPERVTPPPIPQPEPLMATPVEPAAPTPAPPRFEFFRRERPAFMSRFESIAESGPEVVEANSASSSVNEPELPKPEPAKPEPPKDDIDIPAFLRRERKLFQ
ncbi:MAG: cell division protein FtsZ [Bryobacteraceae bacterium]|nr:cell division protein FtsZ [Bryobacteraceae bacterium]